jgi:hydrogenase nickel incorporation protein HypA/HybF
MHELAITESIVEGVLERVGECQVSKVVLEIGRLSGVEPDAVRFCFDVSARGTRMEGAALEILEPPVRGRCRACGRDFEPPDALPLCDCGSADVDLTGGLELRIKAVEVT